MAMIKLNRDLGLDFFRTNGTSTPVPSTVGICIESMSGILTYIP